MKKNYYLYLFIGIILSAPYGCSLRIPYLYSPPLDLAYPPSLSGLTISPNPVSPGSFVTLSTSVSSSDRNKISGTAYISVTNGSSLSPISFRTDEFGELNLSIPINHFTPRGTSIEVIMYVKDSHGNKSNIVSTILDVE
jgi:hypothetical protein